MRSELVDDHGGLSLGQLARLCQLSADQVLEFIEEGVIEPQGRDPINWRFTGVCIRRIRRARRLQQDLGVNRAGAALALDLLDEIETLRQHLRRFDR